VSVLPPDFRWVPDWLAPDEASELFVRLETEIPWEEHTVTIAGRRIPVPRRVAFYGPHAYAYTGIVHPARPLPPIVDGLRRRIETAVGHPFNTVLMNLYRSGADSVSWHSDDDYAHGGHPAVASLSLGATRRFRIAHKRRRGESYGVDLTPGSLLVMEGACQLDYRHALPKTVAVSRVRINLTFRHMIAESRRRDEQPT
jgi:alkylated DNA repair dioxygenase AlkB